MVNRAVFFAVTLATSGCCFGGATTTSPTTTGTTTTVTGNTVTLGPGFMPDPQTQTGSAGGPQSAATMSPDCRGYIATAPNHIINATGAFANLRIVVSSIADTTLVVQRADGSFACNDDSDGLNPVVSGAFGPGQHRVWVGTYNPSAAGAAYTIGFTELMTVTSASLGGGGLGFGLPPQMPPVGGAVMPQECGQSVAMYGPLTVGSSVMLGMHTPYSGPNGQGGFVTMDTNWAPEMAAFAGQRTTITRLSDLDDAGCPGVRVAVDNGQYFWRVRNLSF